MKLNRFPLKQDIVMDAEKRFESTSELWFFSSNREQNTAETNEAEDLPRHSDTHLGNMKSS